MPTVVYLICASLFRTVRTKQWLAPRFSCYLKDKFVKSNYLLNVCVGFVFVCGC
jgi:hypothetical protein